MVLKKSIKKFKKKLLIKTDTSYLIIINPYLCSTFRCFCSWEFCFKTIKTWISQNRHRIRLWHNGLRVELTIWLVLKLWTDLMLNMGNMRMMRVTIILTILTILWPLILNVGCGLGVVLDIVVNVSTEIIFFREWLY